MAVFLLPPARDSSSLADLMTDAASRLVLLDDGESQAWVYPEQGFQLHGFDVGGLRGERVQAISGPRGAREPADRRYGNPVLFPSVGITHGPRQHHWQHDGQTLLMQPHGWARDLYWHVESITKTSVTGVLTPTNGARVAFPFDFELRLTYTLARRSLKLDTTITNTGKTPFPYALGFHPYLRLAAGNKSACKVALPAGVRVQSNDDWRTITRAPFAARTIEATDAELPGSIVLVDTGIASLEVVDPIAKIVTNVSVEDSEGTFPVWVAWSASAEAPYICLEPWTDIPNALSRPDTQTLAGGAVKRYRMTISVRG